MADNTRLNQNTTIGDDIATLDVAGVKHEKVIVEYLVAGVPVMVDATNKLPVTDAVSEASLASIAAEDFATSAKQDVGNASLAAIDAGIPAALGQAAMAASMPVVISSNQTAIPISGTVVATGGLTDAELRATPVPVSATNLDIRDLTFAADKVDASGSTGVGVTGTFFQATQPVSGPLTDAQLRATPVPVSGTVAVTGAGDASAANQATQITAEQAIQAAVQIMDDWDESDRAKVNVIAGQVGIAGGTGTDGATVPRVTLATNVALPAGNNNIGDVDIASIAAGSNIIGNVRIDQTTPGTTNAVQANAGTNLNTSALNLEATQADVRTALQIIDDWDESDRAKVNVIAGQVGIAGGTGTDGATVPRVTLATNVGLPAGTNLLGIVQTKDLPDAASTYALTNVTSTAYEASHVLKASAGYLFMVTGYNSRTSSQFIQLFNSTTVPADTAVPVIIFRVPASSNFSLDLGKYGRYFSTGIAISNSSTGPTKTIGTTDTWYDAQII